MSNLLRVSEVFVTNTEGANTGTSVANIAVGDVLILNEAGTALTGTGNTVTSAANNGIIKFALGITDANGNPTALISNPIDLRYKRITRVTVAGYSAPTEELMTFGYAGSGTSTIPTPANSTEYMLNILIQDDQRAHGNKPSKQTYTYATSSSATAAELTFGMIKQVQSSVYNASTNSYVLAWALTNGTYVALTNNASVTYLGNTITSTAHGLTVGQLVRIGGTAATTPVYKVATVVDANTFTIEGLYMGASGTILAANILGNTVAPTLYGFQLQGRNLNLNNRFYYSEYQKVYFSAGLGLAENLGSTPLIAPVITTPAYEGVGYWQIVRDMELASLGYEGLTSRVSWYDNAGINATPRTVVGNTYNLVTVEFDGIGYVGTQNRSDYPEVVTIAFYSSTAPTASTKQTNFLATLETLGESTGIFVQ